MAELVFKTRAEYEEVIRLRGEVASLEAQYAQAQRRFKEGKIDATSLDAVKEKFLDTKRILHDVTRDLGEFQGELGKKYNSLREKMESVHTDIQINNQKAREVTQKIADQQQALSALSQAQKNVLGNISATAGFDVSARDIATKENRTALVSMVSADNANNPNFDPSAYEAMVEQAAKLQERIDSLNVSLQENAQVQEGIKAKSNELSTDYSNTSAEVEKLIENTARYGEIQSEEGVRIQKVVEAQRELQRANTLYEAQLREVAEAEEKLKKAQESGNQTAIDEATKSLEEEKEAADELKGNVDELTSSLETAKDNANGLFEEPQPKMTTFRTQLREIQQELYTMKAANQEDTQEYKDKLKQLALYKKAMREVGMEEKEVEDPADQFQAMAEAVNEGTGAIQAYQGALALAGIEEKNAQEITAKLTAIMSVSNGVKQMANILNANSVLRMKLVRLWRRMVAAATTEETTATIAANAATGNLAATEGAAAVTTGAMATAEGVATGATWTLAGAMRALGVAIKSIPVIGWIIAGVSALAAAVSFLTGETEEETKAEEKRQEQLRKQNEAQERLGGAIGDTIAKFKALQMEWLSVRDTAAQTDWIEKNKNAFGDMAGAIDSVNKANSVFVENADKVMEALVNIAVADIMKEEWANAIVEYKKQEQAFKKSHPTTGESEKLAGRMNQLAEDELAKMREGKQQGADKTGNKPKENKQENKPKENKLANNREDLSNTFSYQLGSDQKLPGQIDWAGEQLKINDRLWESFSKQYEDDMNEKEAMYKGFYENEYKNALSFMNSLLPKSKSSSSTAKSQSELAAEKAKRDAETANRAWEKYKRTLQETRVHEDNIEKENALIIEAMTDGFEKQQALRDHNHKKQLTQLDRQAEDARIHAIDNLKREWDEEQSVKENEYNNDEANKKAKRKYQWVAFDFNSEEVKRAGQAAYDEVMRQQEGIINKQTKENHDALDAMLSGYEDYTTKKYLLEKNFEQKLTELRAARAAAEKAGDTEKVFMYDAAMSEETRKYQSNVRSLSNSDNSEALNIAASLGQLENVAQLTDSMKQFAEEQLKALQDFTKTDKFANSSVTDQKTILDAINKMQTASVGGMNMAEAAKSAKGFANELVQATNDIKKKTGELNSVISQRQQEEAKRILKEKELASLLKQRANYEQVIKDKEGQLNNEGNTDEDNVKLNEEIALNETYVAALNENIQALITERDAIDGNIQAYIDGEVALRGVITNLQNQATFAASGIQASRKQFDDGMNGVKGVIDGFRNLASSQNLSSYYESILGIIDNFKKITGNVTDKIGEKTSKAGSETAKAASETAKDAAKATTETAKATADAATEATKDVAESVGDTMSQAPGWIGAAFSMADLINEIGLDGLLDNVSSMLEGAVEGIIESIASGKLFESIFNSVIGSIMSPLEAIFGEAGNMKELQEEIDNLTAQSEILAEVGKNLIEALNNATTANARQRYEEAKKTLEAEKENQKKIAEDQLKMWSTGSHSIGAIMASDYKSTLQKLGISSVESLLGMTEEQVNKLKTQNGGKDWAEFESALRKAGKSSDNGDAQGVLDALDRVHEIDKQLEEAANTFKATITGISFDSMFSSFKSTLQDMKSSSKDFAAALEKDLNNAIINALGDKYKGKLEAWYNKWAEQQEKWNAMAENGIDDSEARLIESQREALQREKEAIIQGAIDERDNLLESGVLSETAQNKAGASKGFSSMSSEQADDLNGRFTALQVSNQGILNAEMERNGQMSVLTTSVSEIYNECARNSTLVSSILEIQANSFLELQEINTNTSQAAAYLRMAMPSIEKLNIIAEKL